jgi:predicted secreted hydrolase
LVNRRRFLASTALLFAADAGAAEDYPALVPGRALQFPRDFGSHPAFRLEWWYITGWITGPDRAAYGIQITFFRNRPRVAETNASRFAPRQLLFAHAAVADPRLGRLRHDQRAAREGFGLAGAREPSTDVWIDDWSLVLVDRVYRARIAARDFRFDLQFAPTQAILLQGDAGFSRKGPDPRQSSAYYSEPQLAVAGSIEIGGKDVDVTGTAWLDHEWSSEVLAAEATGWDWAGINLDDGGALMAFRMRDRAGGALWAGGSLRTVDGRVRSFEPNEIRFEPQRQWRSPRTGVAYPVAMAIGAGKASYVLEPLFDDQELDARASTGAIYWEGAVRAAQAGREVGRGYLELTGYGKPLRL